MKYTRLSTLLFLLFVFVFKTDAKEKVSPFKYGLREARTGIDRYRALYRAHYAAIELDTCVSYIGIDSLEIEIPHDAKPIPWGYLERTI